MTEELFFPREVSPKTNLLRFKNLKLKLALLLIIFPLDFYLVSLLFDETIVIFEVKVNLLLETSSKLFKQRVELRVVNS